MARLLLKRVHRELSPFSATPSCNPHLPTPQGWEFAHLLIHSFAQEKWAYVSHLIWSLRANEQLWANRSGRSWQVSECELLDQVAHDKWANVSNLLRSLSTNEQIERIARFFERIAHFSLSLTKNEQFAQKNSNKLYFVCFLHFFVSFLKKSKKFAHSLWVMWANHSGRLEGMNNCEWITQVAHQKWANKQIAHFFEQIIHSLMFLAKTSDSLRILMSKVPTLPSPPLYQTLYREQWKSGNCGINKFY